MKKNLLTVGVAVIDIVMNVDEIPTSAEKYRANDAMIVGGGCAANAASAIVRLGANCTLATRLGQDQIGDMIIAGLRKEQINCQLVKQFAGRRSSFSSVFVDQSGERQIVNFRDQELPATAKWLEQVPFEFDAVLADTRWPEGAVTAMKLAKSNGVPGIIDAEAPFDGAEDALYEASHVVFSAQGLREFSGAKQLPKGLQIASQQLGDFVGVTDGANSFLWRAEDAIEHFPAFRVESVDTLGAGDVWHGAFALALSEKSPVTQAIEFSNAAAALKCTRHGGRAGIPSREETETFIRNYQACN
jgi:sulfofructose kinase